MAQSDQRCMKFDFNVFLKGKYAIWFAMSGCILFLFMILLKLSHLFYINQAVPAVTPLTSDRSFSKKTTSQKALLQGSMFGEYLPPNLDESAIKKTMLDIELLGILFAPDINASDVILRSAGGEERNYRLEDTLPGGAVIKRILVDGIILEYQGALERLNFAKSDLRFRSLPRPLVKD